MDMMTEVIVIVAGMTVCIYVPTFIIINGVFC